MRNARIFLGLGAALLLATAAIHASGHSMVEPWLDGQRGAVLSLLWFTLSIDWVLVALVWAWGAARPDPRLALPAGILAFVPAVAAIQILVAAGPGFFGIWLLAGSAALALAGAFVLHKGMAPA